MRPRETNPGDQRDLEGADHGAALLGHEQRVVRGGHDLREGVEIAGMGRFRLDLG